MHGISNLKVFPTTCEFVKTLLHVMKILTAQRALVHIWWMEPLGNDSCFLCLSVTTCDPSQLITTGSSLPPPSLPLLAS